MRRGAAGALREARRRGREPGGPGCEHLPGAREQLRPGDPGLRAGRGGRRPRRAPGFETGWRARGSGRELPRGAGAGGFPAPQRLSRPWDGRGPLRRPEWADRSRIARGGAARPRAESALLRVRGALCRKHCPHLFREVAIRPGGCDLKVEIFSDSSPGNSETKPNNKPRRISRYRSQKFGF